MYRKAQSEEMQKSIRSDADKRMPSDAINIKY